MPGERHQMWDVAPQAYEEVTSSHPLTLCWFYLKPEEGLHCAMRYKAAGAKRSICFWEYACLKPFSSSKKPQVLVPENRSVGTTFLFGGVFVCSLGDDRLNFDTVHAEE